MLLVLATVALIMATTVKVVWTYNGKPVNFIIDDKGSYSLKLCVQNAGSVEVVAEGVGKISSFEAPGCINIKVYFNKNEGGNVNGLSAYALYVNFKSKGVEIKHLGYLRILKVFHQPNNLLSQIESLGKEAEGVFSKIIEKGKGKKKNEVNKELLKQLLNCFVIKGDKTILYPGSQFNLTFVNKCGTPLNATVKLDIADFQDLVLKTVNVKNKTSVSLRVPKAYSQGPIYLRGVYVQVLGKDLYYIPIYDFFKFFISNNLYAAYYEGGERVTKVEKGALVTGCVYVPQLVPTNEIPTLEGVLRVKKDLAFRPDQVVKKKPFSVSELPFEVCVNFVAKGDWLLRGYKLELVAQGEEIIPILPLQPVAVAKGELSLK